MRQNGYHVTIRAFIASPKNDFAAQARAATTMAELAQGKVITPAFVELALILDVSGKYGSADIPDEPLPDVDLSGIDDAPDNAQDAAMDDPAKAPRQKRGASQG